MDTWKTTVLIVALMLGAGLSSATGDAGKPARDAQSSSIADRNAEFERLMAIARGNREAARPPRGTLDISGLPTLGSAEAPLAIVEFASFDCGFCRRHLIETMPALKQTYIDSGRLRYVFYDFAPDPRQQHALQAAEAAYCAAEQNSYWAFRNRLYRSQGALAEDLLSSHAEAVGLDMAAFAACRESGEHAARGSVDLGLTRRLRIRGTPTFLIGRLSADGNAIELLHRLSGAQSLERFAAGIDAAEQRAATASLK